MNLPEDNFSVTKPHGTAESPPSEYVCLMSIGSEMSKSEHGLLVLGLPLTEGRLSHRFGSVLQSGPSVLPLISSSHLISFPFPAHLEEKPIRWKFPLQMR